MAYASSSFLLHFPSITLIIFLSVSVSNCSNTNHTSCSILYSCGHIQNVGYPFWGDSRPKFCGIPDLKLSCNEKAKQTYPTIRLSGNGGHWRGDVLHINASSHTMLVNPNDLFEYCHAKKSLNATASLKVDAGYNQSIHLFYGCSASCVPRYQYRCSKFDGTKGTTYYFHNQSDISRLSKSCSCKNNFSFPVDKRVLDEINSNTNASSSLMMSALTKWPLIVLMEYIANFSACAKCEQSGGRCGSPEELYLDKFLCYCRDGTQPLICPPESEKKSWLFGTIIAVSVLCGAIVLIVVIIIYAIRRKTTRFTTIWNKEARRNQNVEAFLKNYGSLAPKRYTNAEIKKMTNSFKEKLGEGGYGAVYKGQLQDNRFVAVKKLKKLKGDGDDFLNEVFSISRTNHVNIVSLLGFYFEGNKRALIYEFMPNGSLERFIDRESRGQSLPSETLFGIALGIAKGLDYLHRGCNTRILHFDIKPHNILLDKELRPKISDFGLARLCPATDSFLSMMEPRGTVGYIAPEVFCRNFGGISHKSNVYSYGMMLLDMVCGRRNVVVGPQKSSETYFPDWIYHQLEFQEESEVHEIISNKEFKLKRKMILVGLWCIQSYPSNRPAINRAIEMLEGPLDLLQVPPKPHLSSPPHSVLGSSGTESTFSMRYSISSF